MTSTGSNGFDTTIVQRFVKEIEKHKETLLSYQGSYMKQCREVRDMIKKSKELAKGEGIPIKQLNALLKERDLNRKIENLRAEFEDEEDLETYDQLKEALGDFGALPLGAAALDAKKEADDDDRDLRPPFLRGEPGGDSEETIGAENAKKVMRGIKKLGGNVVGLPGAEASEA